MILGNDLFYLDVYVVCLADYLNKNDTKKESYDYSANRYGYVLCVRGVCVCVAPMSVNQVHKVTKPVA